jgi:hypothetical protein
MLEEGVLGRETTDGAMGVASGYLPAALARVGSNAPSYSQPVRHVAGQLVECAYGIIQVRPMWDCSIVRNIGGISDREDQPRN